jgi:hypothetical protein
MATSTAPSFDHDIFTLKSGLFDTLPPPPPYETLYDSLAPLAAAEVRATLLPPPRPRRRGLAELAGAGVGVALMLAAIVLRAGAHPAPVPAVAAAAPPPVIAAAVVAAPAIAAPKIDEAAPAPAEVAPAPAPHRPACAVARALPAAAPPPDDLATAPAAAPPPSLGDLDTGAAARAIAGAASAAGACLEADDTRTSMSASVTFMPSGRVTTARLTSGPFLGSDVGGCIARALRGASVPPFAGAPVTVNASIRVR